MIKSRRADIIFVWDKETFCCVGGLEQLSLCRLAMCSAWDPGPHVSVSAVLPWLSSACQIAINISRDCFVVHWSICWKVFAFVNFCPHLLFFFLSSFVSPECLGAPLEHRLSKGFSVSQLQAWDVFNTLRASLRIYLTWISA